MTIFETPIVTPIMRFLSWIILLFIGWRPGGSIPIPMKKCVVIAAPHTSNWDFGLFMPLAFALRVRVRVLIKHTLFFPPVGWFLRFCGGMPINRRASRNYVNGLVGEFEKRETFHLLITPEGTRSPRTHWKTGFYQIAMAANVPIVMAAIDVANKRVGVDRIFYPSGDIEADMAEIYAFYDQYSGLRPENYASPNRPAPDEAQAKA